MPKVRLSDWGNSTHDAPVMSHSISLAAVTGRFQPFHAGHLDLVRIALGEAERVIIGITNPDPGSWREHSDSAHRHRPEANPFTFYERMSMIDVVLAEEGIDSRCEIVAFPLDRPDVWGHYIPLSAVQYVRAFSEWERSKADLLASGGYAVRLFDGDPAREVRASSIRAAVREGRLDDVDDLLPRGVRSVLVHTDLSEAKVRA